MGSALIILCAGRSSRFLSSTNKLLYKFKGKPLIRWTLDAYESLAVDEKIAVVSDLAVADEIPAEYSIILNENIDFGSVNSLKIGLDYLARNKFEEALIGLGNEIIYSKEIPTIIKACTTKPVVISTYNKKPGRPVKLHASTWPLINYSGDNIETIFSRFDPSTCEFVEFQKTPISIATSADLEKLKRFASSS